MRTLYLAPQILFITLLALGCRAKMGVKYDKKPQGASDGSITVDQVPVINKSASTAVPVSGTCTYEGVEIFAVATDGINTTQPAMTSCANGTWGTNVDVTPLADGTDNIKVEAGYAGTDSTASTTVSKDTTVSISLNPIADIIQENNIGYAVSGTCETDGAGAVKIDANDSATSIAPVSADCEGGAWSAKLNMSSLDTGKNHITVTAGHTDAAGNSDSASRKTSKKGFPPVFTDVPPQVFTQNVTIETIMIENTGGLVRDCKATPPLPSGLKLAVSGNTCAISGKPTVAAAAKVYKIKGTATDKSSDTIDISIEVKGAKPPILANQTTEFSFVTGFDIPDIKFTNTGATALACSSTPELPTGLAVIAFNKTCQISGNPTTAAPQTVYTITGVAADNSTGSATVKITVIAANPPVFAQPTPQTYTEYTAITPLLLANTGGAAVSCTVNPALPAGLSVAVAADSCEISGTPTVVTALATYTITGTAADNTTGSITVDITVAAAIPPAIADQTPQTYVTTVAIAPLVFTNTGGAAVSCSILPALPSGLSVAESGGTCRITGTPTAAAPLTTYTVTATGANSSTDTATVDITVNLANPPVFAAEGAKTYVATKAISPIIFANSGAAVTNCSVSPNLPDGLTVSINGNSCQITGTPTTATPLATYTITGTAADMSTATSAVDITINAAYPPIIANQTAKTYVETVTITPVDFVNTGDPATLCTVNPPLPAGLGIAVFGTTCRISGTPTTATALTTYTVTATAADTTTDTATIDITVIAAVPPTVTLSATQTSPTNATTINMTAQFGETVTGFTLADITVANGTKGNFVAVDGDTYTFDITAPSGTVTVDVAADVAVNSYGLGNAAATQFSIVYDNVKPTVALTSTQSSPTNTTPINMTAQFSEVVTGFTLSDLVIGNGAAGNFVAVDGDTYTFDVTPVAPGNVTVDIPLDVAQDAATNNNTAATQFAILFDNVGPTPTITSTQTSPTSAATINMTVQFDEVVTGFDLTDITVTNGSKGNFVAVDGDTYTFDITSPTGTVTVNIGAGLAQDAATNGNTAATQFSIIFDAVGPTPTLSAAQSSPTGTIQASSNNLGGIAGYFTDGYLDRSFTGQQVTLSGSGYVGGITGSIVYSSWTTEIRDCYSWANISATGSYVGGITGSNGGLIRNSYTRGNVCSGNCPGTNDGPLSGNGGSLYNAYWDNQTSGWSSGSGFGRTTAEMQNQYNYLQNYDYDFDFATVWRIPGGGGYPVLQWYDPLGSAVTVASLFAGGDGTPGNPWQIANGNQFRNIILAHQIDPGVNDDSYVLNNSISLGSGTINSIGTSSSPFRGNFNGNGYTISNLALTSTFTYSGLFGYMVQATVQNLTVTYTSVTSTTSNIGVIAGYMDRGSLHRIIVRGATGDGSDTVSGTGTVGGLVGQLTGNGGALITESYFEKGTITSTGNTLGGLVANLSDGKIERSFTGNQVTLSGTSYVGGIAGSSYGSFYTPEINDCYSRAAIAATGGYVGGVIGNNGGNVRNSYSAGNVCGGNCPGTNDGPFAGSAGNLQNVYWDNQTSGWVTGSGYGRTTAQLQNMYSFFQNFDQDFDFATVWRIPGGGGYPVHQWFEPLGAAITVSSLFAGGDGTGGTPWQIATGDQFKNMILAHQVDPTTIDDYFILTTNIDVAGGVPSLGTSSSQWKGNFNGDGYTISNVTILDNGLTYTGLFGYASDATVSDLTITFTAVTGGNYTGVLAGQWSRGTVSRVVVKGVAGDGSNTVTGTTNTGGLIGYLNGNSTAYIVQESGFERGTVAGTSPVGGLVGYSYDGRIQRSYAGAFTNVSGTSYVGGLVGRSYYDFYSPFIRDSYSWASVTATGNNVGGFIGQNGGTITNAYSVGQVCTAGNCPGTGDGPFAGIAGTLTSVFWNTTTSGWSSGSGTMLTDAQFTTDGNLNTIADGLESAGWDNVTVWELDPNVFASYPTLRWQMP